jgi:predicted heme/steroid binding protein
MQMAIPQNFFTLESMLTLTGASGATYLIANGCQNALSFNPKWLALAIAQALSWYGTYVSTYQATHHMSEFFVAFVNGFLIYATAAGANAATAPRQAPANPMGFGGKPPQRRSFLSRW